MNNSIERLNELKRRIENSSIEAAAKCSMLDEIDRVKSPLQTDRFIYRAAVVIVGAALVLSLGCSFFLLRDAPKDYKLPDIFIAVASGAVGALAGLIARRDK